MDKRQNWKRIGACLVFVIAVHCQANSTLSVEPNSNHLALSQQQKKALKRSTVTLVKVDKSARRMYLMSGSKIFREYRIALGANPRGHKEQEGDKRTPEGQYTLDFVIEGSAFHRSVHISYPNKIDRYIAKTRGVSPGGNIKIHGLKNNNRKPAQFIQSFDWTDGCIAITNQEMDEFLRFVSMGTPIYIEW